MAVPPTRPVPSGLLLKEESTLKTPNPPFLCFIPFLRASRMTLLTTRHYEVQSHVLEMREEPDIGKH